jgi:hypothetical protein
MTMDVLVGLATIELATSAASVLYLPFPNQGLWQYGQVKGNLFFALVTAANQRSRSRLAQLWCRRVGASMTVWAGTTTRLKRYD